jgi:hypothetical protein
VDHGVKWALGRRARKQRRHGGLVAQVRLRNGEDEMESSRTTRGI